MAWGEEVLSFSVIAECMLEHEVAVFLSEELGRMVQKECDGEDGEVICAKMRIGASGVGPWRIVEM